MASPPAAPPRPAAPATRSPPPPSAPARPVQAPPSPQRPPAATPAAPAARTAWTPAAAPATPVAATPPAATARPGPGGAQADGGRWSLPHYVVKEKRLTFGRQYRIFDGNERLVAYCKQKVFRLREDIRFYADEGQQQELFRLATQRIIDFNANFAVTESQTGRVLGYLRRKGWKSLFRDEWLLFDAEARPIGNLHEDSAGKAFMRRFLLLFGALGALIATAFPMGYHLLLGPAGAQREAAAIRERWQFYGDTYDLRILPGAPVDARLLIGLTVCADAIEGK